MTDAQLLSAAITASGLPARRFAVEVLGVEDRSVRRWLVGRDLPGTVRVVCAAIIERPSLAAELIAANATVLTGGTVSV